MTDQQTRRRFLAAAGSTAAVAVAGCIGSGGSDPETETDAESMATESMGTESTEGSMETESMSTDEMSGDMETESMETESMEGSMETKSMGTETMMTESTNETETMGDG